VVFDIECAQAQCVEVGNVGKVALLGKQKVERAFTRRRFQRNVAVARLVTPGRGAARVYLGERLLHSDTARFGLSSSRLRDNRSETQQNQQKSEFAPEHDSCLLNVNILD